MNNSTPRKDPQSPSKPQDVPGKENTPKQPETYPPGDRPITPTDPDKQPIDIQC